jgi:integrase
MDAFGRVTDGLSFFAIRLFMLLRVPFRTFGRVWTQVPTKGVAEGVQLVAAQRLRGVESRLDTKRLEILCQFAGRQLIVIRFLAYTGLRWGEMAALRVGDFDMLRRRVNVSRSVTEFNGLVWSTPKSWERRSVPFPAALADELSAPMVGKGRDALVFTNTSGGVLRASNYRKRFFAAAVSTCQKADESFPTVTPHDLRHTAASLAVSAGANVKAVQRMLGHAKASMTLDVYADLFDDELDSVAASLDTAIKTAADDLRTISAD